MVGLSLFTLGDIRTKVRNLTGHKSTNDLSADDLLDYINRYYQLVFPLEVRPYELRTWFGFDVADGTEEHDLTTQTDSTTSLIYEDAYLTLENPSTIDGYSLTIYLDPALFYDKWPETTTYDESRPTDVLFYEQKLLFRATPDDTYTVKIASWRKPSALSSDTDYPMQEEWGPLIAYGAAREVAEDYGDIETLQKIEPLYQQHKVRLNNKIHFQNVDQRSVPKF